MQTCMKSGNRAATRLRTDAPSRDAHAYLLGSDDLRAGRGNKQSGANG